MRVTIPFERIGVNEFKVSNQMNKTQERMIAWFNDYGLTLNFLNTSEISALYRGAFSFSSLLSLFYFLLYFYDLERFLRLLGEVRNRYTKLVYRKRQCRPQPVQSPYHRNMYSHSWKACHQTADEHLKKGIRHQQQACCRCLCQDLLTVCHECHTESWTCNRCSIDSQS